MASTADWTYLPALGVPHQRGEVGHLDFWRVLADTVAERAVAIGVAPDGLGELVAASRDVVIEVVRAFEEQLWMFRVQFGDSGSR